MTKEEALKRVEELGGDKRKGECPMLCMPLMKKTMKITRKGVRYTKIQCYRDCCKFEPPYIYETRDKDWDVMYMSCGYHD